MGRRKHRGATSVKVFAEGKPGESRRLMKFVDVDFAVKLLNECRAKEEFDDERGCVGIRLCVSPREAMKANHLPPASIGKLKSSCVVLSKAEVEAIAFRAPSHTAGLTDAQRDARVASGLPDMDLVERAREKFKQMFPGARDFASQSA